MPTRCCRRCRRIVPTNTCEEFGVHFFCRHCFDTHYFRCAECQQIFERSHGRYSQNNPDSRICSHCYYNGFTTWEPAPLTGVSTSRCFGIELETSRCKGYKSLRGQTLFGAKHDGSISGMEFVSPILWGQEGLDEIKNFCKLAKHFQVNGDCGYHLHIDMRNTTAEQRRSIVYAYYLTYHIWSKFINQYRAHDCRYCRAPGYSLDDIVRTHNFNDFCNGQDRYEFLNLQAYYKYKTFEIRGYEGTLNPVEICNWIDVHLKFVTTVQDKSLMELRNLFAIAWPAMKRIFGPDMARFYGRKMARVSQLGPNVQHYRPRETRFTIPRTSRISIPITLTTS